MVIDSKQYEISVEFDSIEIFKEIGEGRLNLQYYVPGADGGSQFQKRNEVYDCCENDDLLQAYQSIKQQVENNEFKGIRQTQSFSGTD